MYKYFACLLFSFAVYGETWSGKLYYKDQGKNYVGGYYSIASTNEKNYSIKIETPGNVATFVVVSNSTNLNFANKQFVRNKFIPELTHNYYWTISINNSKPNLYCYAESFLMGASGNYRLTPKYFYLFSN